MIGHTYPIVVVEDLDEDFDTLLIAARLAGVRQEILRAVSGDECLRLLRGAGGKPTPQFALLLLDLNTPGGDGRSALGQIRTDPDLSAIPLVVFSTSASPRDVDFCYAHGANAYHVKPVSHAEHLLVLQSIFAYWLGSVLLPTAPTLER
jgi:CheY-like chemotaxis protein